jgi:DHA1 family arabinose polymer transporter-like MFS transporter
MCGALSMSIAAPINIMMMKAAPKSEMMAAAFMQAGFNIANAMGAFLGEFLWNMDCHSTIRR